MYIVFMDSNVSCMNGIDHKYFLLFYKMLHFGYHGNLVIPSNTHPWPFSFGITFVVVRIQGNSLSKDLYLLL